MGLEILEKEIDGFRYKYRQMPVKPALKLQVKFTRLLGKANIDIESMKAEEVNVMLGMKALVAIIGSVEYDDLESLILELARQSCFIDGSKEPELYNCWDTHFEGRLMSLYKWVAFCLYSQFSDFFAGLVDLTRDYLPDMAQSGLESTPSTSMSQNGASFRPGSRHFRK